MKNKLLIIGVVSAGLTACVGIPSAPKGPEVIRYATGPCLGTCPVYVVTVSSDGIATFDGRQHTAVTGKRTFAISTAEWEQFKGALAPYRPEGSRELRGAACTTQATDLPSIEIAWTDEQGPDILHVDTGCDMEANAAMFQTLQTAPRYLPLDIFVGRR